MIIGIDASRANHEQRTGVENYAFFLIQEMKKLIGGEIGKLGNYETSELKIILYSNVPLQGELAKLPPHWESKVLRWPPKRLWTHVRLSFEMLIHPPDVLFVPAHVFPIIHPKKTVMTVHDVAALRFPASYNWFERWYSLFSAKMAMKKLWKIIVPSQFTKDELLKFEITTAARRGPAAAVGNSKLQEKVYVISHGYNNIYSEKRNDTDIARILNKYSLRQPFIMSIGRLEEKKNTVRIIEAFNLIRSKEIASSPAKASRNDSKVQLLLVGRPGHGYEKIKEAIEQSPHRQDIITPGWVDEADVPILMSAAEVFVFPSLYEGFGLPVLEAFAGGVPVVASRGSSLEEVGGDAAMYVDPQNSEEIAQAVIRLVSDETLRKEKIRLGSEQLKKFDWQTCAQMTLDVLTAR